MRMPSLSVLLAIAAAALLCAGPVLAQEAGEDPAKQSAVRRQDRVRLVKMKAESND